MSSYANATMSDGKAALLQSTLDLKTACLLLLCAVLGLFSWLKYGNSNSTSVPKAVMSWGDIVKSTNYGGLMMRGYNNYAKGSNRAFEMKGMTLLPPSLFSEARKLPSNVLSFEVAAEETLLLRFSLGRKHSEHLTMVAHDLARNLNSQVEPLLDEICYIFDDIFLPLANKPDVDGQWHTVHLHPIVLRMIGITVSRAFVGKELCRDETFTKTIAQFANGVIMQLFILQVIPGEYVKTQLAKVLPQRKRIAALREMVRIPVLRRVEEIQNGKVNDEDYTVLCKIVDMVVSKYYPGKKEFDTETREGILRISSTRLLALMFGAIDTTTMATCQVIFDMIGHPKAQYADPLREEVERVFRRNGGEWDINAINELQLLDSFIKESQRLHAVGFTLGSRKVVKPGGIKFSNGDFIPEGHTVSHPLYAIHRDPDYYENPDTFDGFRFARGQNDEPKALSGPQISDQFLAFGFGRYACPGRAFALVVIKLMMVQFLTKSDFKEAERPKDWAWGNGLLPDMKTKVLVKRRDVSS